MLSLRTGLDTPEIAVLRAVASAGGERTFRPAEVVLDQLAETGLSTDHGIRAIQHLAAPWSVHLPLVVFEDEVVIPGDTPVADLEGSLVRLSEAGRLGLTAEDGEVGPAPIGLVDGSAFRGGPVPPFAPGGVVAAVRAVVDGADPIGALGLLGSPALPSDTEATGDLNALLTGAPAAFAVSCRIRHAERDGRPALALTGFPPGIGPDRVGVAIAYRSRTDPHPDVVDLQDRSRMPTGTRLEVIVRRGGDREGVETWLRAIDPVTIDVTWQLLAPMSTALDSWGDRVRESPDGLAALARLVGRD